METILNDLVEFNLLADGKKGEEYLEIDEYLK